LNWLPQPREQKSFSCSSTGRILHTQHLSVGYSDFHNLVGFTSKKMPNNIQKNICQQSFLIG
jgi:hypothetical protein